MDHVPHWIGGKEVDDTAGRAGPVYDPATGEMSARVPLADQDLVDTAVADARDAWSEWRVTSLSRISKILFAYRQILCDHRDELVELVCAEHGKVRDDAAGEVQRGLEVVEFACGIPHLLKGEFSENVSTDVDTHSMRQPVGIVAGITPFNFPVMVPMWMAPLAIACRNTFVLKPSERDPSAPVLLARLFSEAGLPDGVFNVVHGDKRAVDALLTHADVAAVSSVGSTPVARHIYATAAAAGKRVQALGGAKNHLVVLPDADLDAAADAAVSAAYGSAGQRCMAISSLVTTGGSGDELIPRIADCARAIKLGPGRAPESEMGPLVSADALERVRRLVQEGVDEGADLVVDGRDVDVPGHRDGFFVGPSLFDAVTPRMSIYREEIFGPVLINLRVDDVADALELVNANPYGNGAAIYTRSGSAARAFSHGVEAGMVGVNVPIPVPMAYHSFGGWKASLFGGSHVHGMEGVQFYTRTKTVTTRWPKSTRSAGLAFPSG